MRSNHVDVALLKDLAEAWQLQLLRLVRLAQRSDICDVRLGIRNGMADLGAIGPRRQNLRRTQRSSSQNVRP